MAWLLGIKEEPTKEPQDFQGDLARQHFPNADKKYNSIRTYSIKCIIQKSTWYRNKN